MKFHSYHYNIVIRAEPEGGYTATVPSLPGCVTYGSTLQETKAMAKDAIEAYLASLEKHKEPIPTDNETFFATLDLSYAKTS
jgi:antitoxin HicB